MANYQKIATDARKTVLRLIYEAQTSHIGSNFSCIDILTVLFECADLTKDKILYSKGWIAASAFYFLAQKGFFPKEDLETFCKPESSYIGLVEPTVPGIWGAGGSMGYGLSFGVAFAWDKKDREEDGKIFVIMSDGEQTIGMNWEAAAFAAHHHLDNLVAIVDRNSFQAMGRTSEVLDIEPLAEKWSAFGWRPYILDGHNFLQIEGALARIPLEQNKPTILIADTIKGKGVSFFENNNDWHYRHIDEESYNKALHELAS